MWQKFIAIVLCAIFSYFTDRQAGLSMEMLGFVSIPSAIFMGLAVMALTLPPLKISGLEE
jgi:hypothetical protein